MIVNERKFVPLEVFDKAFQVMFDFRDLREFKELLPVKLENVNVQSCPANSGSYTFISTPETSFSRFHPRISYASMVSWSVNVT